MSLSDARQRVFLWPAGLVEEIRCIDCVPQVHHEWLQLQLLCNGNQSRVNLRRLAVGRPLLVLLDGVHQPLEFVDLGCILRTEESMQLA